MKVIIVGGVAGGASCAARLRRLDEKAEIVMVERGPYVSYANCGLPYHVGGVIEKESSLIVASEQFFRSAFAIDARTNCEAIAISAKKKTVDLRNVKTGEVTTESYDKLVLSPGAPSVHPPLPGIDLPGIFHVRTVPDVKKIREWIEKGTTFLAGMSNYSGIQMLKPTRRAVVVGGGFIGLEMAENLVHLGFDVTLMQKLPQLLGPIDPEIARLVEGHVRRHGVKLALNDGATGFTQLEGGALNVQTISGKTYPADVVILAIGVRPDTTLAKTAGIEIGERGGIRVDEHMRTSDPDIFAVGDAIEVKDFVTGQWSLIALAGPANRQGRIAADVIAGRDSRYRGTQGTSIIGLFGGAAAWTGASEKLLKKLGDRDYEKLYLFPNSHAGYYPGAKMLGLKVLFRKSDGRLLGAQALGEDGPAVDKRISALAHGHPDEARPFTISKKPNFATRRNSAAQKIPLTSPEWLRRMFFTAICRSVIGIHWTARSSWTCAKQSNWPSKASPVRSTFRWVSFARVSANSLVTARSTSFAVRLSALTTQRASCCRTASRHEIFPAACCHAPCSRQIRGHSKRRVTDSTAPDQRSQGVTDGCD